MREQLLHLIEVQKIDAKIAEIKKSSEQYPRRLAALEEKRKNAEKQVKLINEELENLEKDYSERNEALKIEDGKVKKWEMRLNDIRNQREYISLSHEIESSKRQNKDESEHLEELRSTINEKGKIRDTLTDDLAEISIDSSKETTELQEKIAAANDDIAAQVKIRDGLLNNVNANILKRYERIRDHRKGIALVPAKDGCCMGCHMNIPPQLYNTLLKVDQIITCPCCGRILYWEGILAEDNK